MKKHAQNKIKTNAHQRERYIRWQNYRITQLSFSINLFLSFAAASLAYAINIKLENKAHADMPIDPVIICWAYSALIGCLAMISKLCDYRYTARKIKHGGAGYKFMANHCGHFTWGWFWGLVVTYAIGGYLFVGGIINN